MQHKPRLQNHTMSLEINLQISSALQVQIKPFSGLRCLTEACCAVPGLNCGPLRRLLPTHSPDTSHIFHETEPRPETTI